MKWKKRRRTSQVFATERPNPYIILSFLAVGVALLLFFFWPYGGVTSPAHAAASSADKDFPTNMTEVVPMPAGQADSTNVPAIPLPSDATNADGTPLVPTDSMQTNVPANATQSQ